MNVHQASALTVDGLQEPGVRVEKPGSRDGAVLEQIPHHLTGSVGPRLQQQRRNSRHVGGRHGGTAQQSVASLTQGKGGEDHPPRRGQIGLQVQVRAGPVRAEGRDVTRAHVGHFHEVVGPKKGGGKACPCGEVRTVFQGEGACGKGDLRETQAGDKDARRVVVDEGGDGAVAPGIQHLFP